MSHKSRSNYPTGGSGMTDAEWDNLFRDSGNRLSDDSGNLFNDSDNLFRKARHESEINRQNPATDAGRPDTGSADKGETYTGVADPTSWWRHYIG